MQKMMVNLPQVQLIGLTVRTNKESMRTEVKTKEDISKNPVMELVIKYYHGQLFNKIPNRKEAGRTFCVHTNYDNQEDGDFTYFIGEEVTSFDIVPEGFSTLTIPAQKYAAFKSEPGSMPTVRDDLWEKVSNLSSTELEGERAYSADFEVYEPENKGHDNIVLDIYIGIK